MSSTRITFMLAGGGTGGHLFPAVAVAEALRRLRPEAVIVFVGTKDRMEARLVPELGYRLETLWISGVQRKKFIKNLLVPLKVIVSVLQSFILLLRERPTAVLGTGGYVCGPILFAARILGVPTFIHESNSYPGATTRMLASRVTKVFLAFEDSKQWLPTVKNAEILGTPTRSALDAVSPGEARRFFGLTTGEPVLLVSGGSQGASALNDAVLDMLDDLKAAGVGLIWQTGERYYESIRRRLGDREVGWVGPFIDSMGFAYAAADLVLCRAGAATIAELIRTGKPSVLVPYPFAAGDHQSRNAQSLVREGAAELVAEDAIETLKGIVMRLLRDAAQRERMSAAARRLFRADSAGQIAQQMVSCARPSSTA